MIPQNEMGVISLFTQQANDAGFKIVSIQRFFPDAIVERSGQTYRAEFEYKAANFVQHGHDVRECDLIICWKNNYPDSILPVLALSEDDWQSVPLDLPTEAEREAAHNQPKPKPMLPTVFDQDGLNDMFFTCLACGRSGIVYYNTKKPQYCNGACRAKAYRERKKRDKDCVTNCNSGQTRQQIERNLDQALHLMTCNCGRGIWTVKGNVQIGGLLCGLCQSEFRR